MAPAFDSDPRDKKRTAVERAFEEASDQLAEIRRELLDAAPRAVESVVDDWVVEQTRRYLLQMRGTLETKRQQASKHVTSFDSERPEARRARYQAFVGAVDPRVIAEEFESTQLARGVWTTYKHAFAELRRKSFYGRLLGRYELPESVVRLLVERAVECLSEARSAYTEHVRQYRASAKYLDSSVAGVGDLTPHLERSVRDAYKTFEHACDEIVTVRENLETNLRLVLMTLYVGGVVRFARDLAAMGRELMAIDFDKADLRVELRSTEKAAFHDWCASAQAELTAREKARRWSELATISTRALDFVTADPARRNELAGAKATPYAVLFARARCRALTRAADAAWGRGDLVVAATLYRAVLEGTNLVWERGNGRTPKAESIARAGMRLALACTSKNGRRIPNAGSIVTALVVHVQQAAVRLDSDTSDDSVNGEALDPHTLRCARVLAAYCVKEKIPIVPPAGLRGALQHKVEQLGWDPKAATPLMAEVGGWAKRVGGSVVKDSALLLWLRSTVTRRRLNISAQTVKITASVLALAGAVYWLSGMVPKWKEQLVPTRLAGTLESPAHAELGLAWEELMSQLTPEERVELAEQMWERTPKEELLSLGQLQHLKASLAAAPAGSEAAKRASRLQAQLESRYLAARSAYVQDAQFPHLGEERQHVRANGVGRRELRVTSAACDASNLRRLVEQLGAALRRLDFSEIECARPTGTETWKEPL